MHDSKGEIAVEKSGADYRIGEARKAPPRSEKQEVRRWKRVALYKYDAPSQLAEGPLRSEDLRVERPVPDPVKINTYLLALVKRTFKAGDVKAQLEEFERLFGVTLDPPPTNPAE